MSRQERLGAGEVTPNDSHVSYAYFLLDVMADKKKESTPPPLLLMPAGGGLTLTPPDQPNFLMPVIQSEPALIDEDAEADSFVGQAPLPGTLSHAGLPPHKTKVDSAVGNVTFFQPQGGSSLACDPFAQVFQPQSGHPPPPTAHVPINSETAQGSEVSLVPSLQETGQTGLSTPSSVGAHAPPMWSSAPCDKANINIYRQKGPLRYAQPPAGTYASTSGFVGEVSAPSTNFTTPPSGFAPSPFMHPPSTGTGSLPIPGSYVQSASSSPFTQQSPSQGPPVTPVFSPPVGGFYRPVQHHWCYVKAVEGREVWYTFSRKDSHKLEEQFLKGQSTGNWDIVSTDGGRYDVDIGTRLRRAIYWEEEPTPIRRCSWFYKREIDNRYVPYDEAQAQKLEVEYKNALEKNDWHRRLEFPGKETIVMHNPQVIVHFQASSQPDEWGNVQGDQMRPRVVKRGVEDFESIEEGESDEVDHLVFFVHGIGNTCDARFRNIVACVDDFRSNAHSLLESHFGTYCASGLVHRVEFLPVHWHMAVHSEATGVDSRLTSITLPSTRKLRNFINDTLLDILFYTSPAYCQVICDTVGHEMNRLFQIFLARNPTFSGEVSLAGHSLGASILFDLLMHQKAPGECLDINGHTPDSIHGNDSDISLDQLGIENEEENQEAEECKNEEVTLEVVLQKVGLTDKIDIFHKEQIDLESLSMCGEQDLKDLGLPMGPRKKLLLLLQEHKDGKEKKKMQDLEKKIRKELEKKLKANSYQKQIQQEVVPRKAASSISVDYICGLAGTGQPFVRYPQLEFLPSCLFALGSPIGVFLSARGVQQMGENFKLPTCSRFFNIFHPFDAVAYRIEPLINPSASTLKPVLIPHYKGRKRLHLELKESISRMGTDLKQKIIESLRSTWNSLNEFARAHRSDAGVLENPDSQGLEHEVNQQVDSVMAQMAQSDTDKSETGSVCSSHDEDISIGQINEGRRVDYVLQEKPIESFNDYLFALASHGCYWTSEDTALLVLKEIYAPLGITPIMPGPETSGNKAALPLLPPKPGGPFQPGHAHAFTPSPTGSFPQQFRPATPSAHHPPSMHQSYMHRTPTPAPSPFGLPVTCMPSQGNSRASTPIQGPPVVQSSQEGAAGPPPVSGFVPTSALK